MTDAATVAPTDAGAHFPKVYGETLRSLPRDLYIPPDALEVYLDAFEGPLDLLLYLIRKANVDILDVPMAPLTRQYLEYVESMRKRSIEEIHKSIKNAETRIVEIRALRKKFENEAEFYKKKKLPADVEKGLSDTDFEIKGQEAIIQSKKKEIDAVQAKYDEDRKRFLELMHRRAAPK